MCPLCWATLLAAFSLSVGTSVVLIAGRDRWTLLLASGLILLAAAYQFEAFGVPWSAFAGLMAAAMLRVAWLALRRRDRMWLFAAWRRAADFAAARCPKRSRDAGQCLIDRADSSLSSAIPERA